MAYFVNLLSADALMFSASLNFTTNGNLSWELSPENYTLAPGANVAVTAKVSAVGVAAGTYAANFLVMTQTIKSFVISKQLDVTVHVMAAANALKTRIQILDDPCLGKTWTSLKISPYDGDGIRILTDTGELFDVQLEKASSSVSCNILWSGPDRLYYAVCDVPSIDVAGV